MHLELSVIKYIKPSTPRCTASTEAPSFPARQHHGLTQQCFWWWWSTQLSKHHNWTDPQQTATQEDGRHSVPYMDRLCLSAEIKQSKTGIEIKKKKKDFQQAVLVDLCVIFNDCKAEWGGSRWWRSYSQLLHRSWDWFLSWGTPARCDRTLRPLRTKKSTQPTHKDLCLVYNAQNMIKLHSYVEYNWAWNTSFINVINVNLPVLMQKK